MPIRIIPFSKYEFRVEIENKGGDSLKSGSFTFQLSGYLFSKTFFFLFSRVALPLHH